MTRPSSTTDAPGTLHVVAVPIGHMDDLTIRARDILRTVDLIATEDPEATHALLAHHGIRRQDLGSVTSYHHANRDEKTATLCRRLQDGQSVALVVDTGTPAVYDPGAFLVRAARRLAIRIDAIPGPSALTAALSVSGLDTDRTIHLGRLPHRKAAAKALLRPLARLPYALVVFLDPRRLEAELGILADCLGDREACLCWNLTGPGEQLTVSPLSTLREIDEDRQDAAQATIVIASKTTARTRPRRRSRRT
ncbi:MAG: SAM-dependent methyltransferase [Nitrospiraceae bacterium]